MILIIIVVIVFILLSSSIAVWWFLLRKIDGGWSGWSEDITAGCVGTCGTGSIKYIRECTNPTPKNDGAECIEDDDGNTDTKLEGTCNLSPCFVPKSIESSTLALTESTTSADQTTDKSYVVTKSDAVGKAGTIIEGEYWYGTYTPFDLECPEGSYITKFKGQYGTFINSIGLICSDNTEKGPVGGPLGDTYSIDSGSGFDSLDVRAGDIIDGIVTGDYSAGSSGGTLYPFECANGKISGIHGTNSESVIGSLGITCMTETTT